jgi:septum formation protein
MTQFILASQSPRRRELLRQVGFDFEVRPASVVEVRQGGESPAAYALRLAQAKARAFGPQARPVLGADTDVVVDDDILGKPRDRDDALAMLARLADREHEVYSAVAVVEGARCESALAVTRVRFGPVSPAQAAAYWAGGEPIDKAGAYAIQGCGALFVREIHGSYSGVVGLPLYETAHLLARFGILPK